MFNVEKAEDMSWQRESHWHPARFAATLLVLAILGVGGFVVMKMGDHANSSHPGQIHRHFGSRPEQSIPFAASVSGERIQGNSELLAVSDAAGDPAVPDAAAHLTASRLLNFVQSGTGIALWIKTKTDLGIVQLPIVPGSSRHQVGAYTLLTSASPDVNGVSVPNHQWLDSSGKPLAADRPEPYQVQPIWSVDPTKVSDVAKLPGSLMLVPGNIEDRIQVQATPLGGTGSQCSPTVRLRAQPAGNNLIFIRIPGGYSNGTKAFRVEVADSGAKAVWTVANLPASRMVATEDEITAGPTKIKSLSITPTVTEGPDQWFPWSPPNKSMVQTAAWSTDDHYATGLPTLDCTLTAANSEKAGGDTWRIVVQSIKPQWSGRSGSLGTDLGPSDTQPLVCNAGGAPVMRRYAMSSVYPGQQKCVSIQGYAERVHTVSEPVTFQDADLRYSRGLNRWIIQWNRQQLVTTPSGVVIGPFNRRMLDDMQQSDSDTEWAAMQASELNLGIKLPAKSSSQSVTTVDLADPFRTLCVVGGHDGWRSLWVPGQPPPVRHFNRRAMLDSPIFPFFHDGFSTMCLAVGTSAGVKPATLDTEIPACPLPAHIDSIKLIVHTQTVIDKEPFSIVAPVKPRAK